MREYSSYIYQNMTETIPYIFDIFLDHLGENNFVEINIAVIERF